MSDNSYSVLQLLLLLVLFDSIFIEIVFLKHVKDKSILDFQVSTIKNNG